METAQEVVRGMLDKQKLGTFVLGGIAGALAGILLAPKSGKELRGSITSHAGEARERGRETYFEAQERMQERLTETLERSPRREEVRTFQDNDAEEPLPTESEPATPKPVLGPEPPVGTPPDPTPLRDVSRDMPRPVFGEETEEIRRKIQETRSRLRARLDSPGPEDAPGDKDG